LLVSGLWDKARKLEVMGKKLQLANMEDLQEQISNIFSIKDHIERLGSFYRVFSLQKSPIER